jgi:hypothetical protein
MPNFDARIRFACFKEPEPETIAESREEDDFGRDEEDFYD